MKKLLALVFALVLCLSITPQSSASDQPTPPASSDYAELVDDGRRTYSGNNRPSRPVFNSITDAPTIGDERQFVVITELDSSVSAHFEYPDEQTYQSYHSMTPYQLKPNCTYRAAIYYHNDAPAGIGDGDMSATDVKVAVQIPDHIGPDDPEPVLLATISSGNAKPAAISSLVRLTTEYASSIRISADSVKIYCGGQAGGSALPEDLFADGTKIGYNFLNGIIPANQFGYVYFDFKVVPDNPEEIVDVQPSTPDTTAPASGDSMPDALVIGSLTVSEMLTIGVSILALIVVARLYLYVRRRLKSRAADESADFTETE